MNSSSSNSQTTESMNGNGDQTDSLFKPALVANQDFDVHREAMEMLLSGSSRSDRWLIEKGDWFSPILVKEVRQALKSAQFLYTFSFLMIAILLWTVFATVNLYPAIYYYPQGKSLLLGYLFILIVPTIVIVPNAAYRSMAAELDQGTFEILSITPLSSYRIVLGKVAVAMVQAGVYFSALAPCIALTYLLRGLPLTMIAQVLLLVATTSFVVSCISIVLATLSRFNSIQVLNSLFTIIVSIGSAIFLFFSLASYIQLSSPSSTILVDLTLFILGLVLFASYGVLMLLVAASIIGIKAENYTTRIRIWILLQSFYFFTYLIILFEAYNPIFNTQIGPTGGIPKEFLITILITLSFHWGIPGMFFLGESVSISPRVQRQLPSNLMTRLLCSWWYPGPGTGYMFTVLSYASVAILASTLMQSFTSDYSVINYGVLLTSYLIVYLGVARLLMLFVPATSSKRMVIAFAVTGILVMFGIFIPISIRSVSDDFYLSTMPFYKISNPFMVFGDSQDIFLFAPLAAVIAFVVFTINVFYVFKDQVLIRVNLPPRVAEESNRVKQSVAIVDPLA